MDIRSALDRIIATQDGLSITDPATVSILKAYKYSPPASEQLPDLPAFTNDWSLTRYDRHTGLRIRFYTVHMQLFVYDADQDRAADIATAFHEKLLTQLDADVTLNNTVVRHDIRGGNPTLVAITRSNQVYIGLDMFLDVEMKEAATFT